jgi:hypothetical protein
LIIRNLLKKGIGFNGIGEHLVGSEAAQKGERFTKK